MKRVILILIVMVMMVAVAVEARVERYKFQGTALTASTDGQAPDLAWRWRNGTQSWKAIAKDTAVDLQDATNLSVQYDTLSNSCTAGAVIDINFLPSITGILFDNDPYYSKTGIAVDKVKTIGVTVPSSYMKISFDETGGQACTVDVQIEVTTPY